MLVITTDRLVLREPRLDDAAAIQAYFADWEIIRWLRPPVPWPYPLDGALTYIQRQLPEQGKAAITFAITRKNQDEAIGIVDIRIKQDGEGQYAERGFSLSRQFWGQGLMHEATEAVTDYLFTQTALLRLVTFNAPDNQPSRRLQAKQGHRFLGIHKADTPNYNGNDQQEKWLLTRADWLALQKKT